MLSLLYYVIMVARGAGYSENGYSIIGYPDKRYSEIGHSENGNSEGGNSEDGYPDYEYSERGGRVGCGRPRWQLCVEEDGQLTAVLTGSEPPITVSGESLASLRRQMRNAMLHGLL